MKMHSRLPMVLLTGLVLLSACDQPVIDTSSDRSTEDSLAMVRADLPAARRAAFDEALRLMAYAEIGVEDIYSAGRSGEIIRNNKIRSIIHGKTAEQVIEEGARIKTILEREQRNHDLQEARNLQDRLDMVNLQREDVAGFRILESTFHKDTGELLGFSTLSEAAIRLKVRNDTPHIITRAEFEGALVSPGRDEPWVLDVFSLTPADPLQPQQEGVWETEAPFFLTNTEVPEDAGLRVSLLHLFGEGDEELYSAGAFTPEDQERLDALKTKYRLP